MATAEELGSALSGLQLEQPQLATAPTGQPVPTQPAPAGQGWAPRGAAPDPAPEINWDVPSRGAPDTAVLLPRPVLEAYANGKMTRDQMVELESDVKEGAAAVPDGFRLKSTQAPGFFSRIGEAITGNERATDATRGMEDYVYMPELQEASGANLKATLGSLTTTDPNETAQIIQSNFPDVSLRYDEKGNIILKSAKDGNEYAIKPGFQMSDVPKTLAAGLAFTPAGRATSIGGAALAGAGTQTALETVQAATGGSFDPSAIALEGVGGALGQAAAPLLGRLVGRLRGGTTGVAMGALPESQAVGGAVDAAPSVGPPQRGIGPTGPAPVVPELPRAQQGAGYGARTAPELPQAQQGAGYGARAAPELPRSFDPSDTGFVQRRAAYESGEGPRMRAFGPDAPPVTRGPAPATRVPPLRGEGPTPVEVAKAARSGSGSLEEQIEEVGRGLIDSEYGGRVVLSDIRKAFPGVPKARMDEALKDIQSRGAAVLYRSDWGPQASEIESAGHALEIGGNKRHIIWFEGRPPAPAASGTTTSEAFAGAQRTANMPDPVTAPEAPVQAAPFEEARGSGGYFARQRRAYEQAQAAPVAPPQRGVGPTGPSSTAPPQRGMGPSPAPMAPAAEVIPYAQQGTGYGARISPEVQLPQAQQGAISAPRAATPDGASGASPEEFTKAAVKAGRGGHSAQERFAGMAAETQDPDVLAAAHRLDIADHLQPDHTTTSGAFRDLSQAIKAIPSSQLRAAEMEGLHQVGERAVRMIDDLGGSSDLSQLNYDIRTQMTNVVTRLEEEADVLYSKLRQAIPNRTPVTVDSVLDFVRTRADDLGGAENLSPMEKKILSKLSVGEDGVQPTYALMDDIRKDVGAAARMQGPFQDADVGLAKKLYHLMSDDQAAVAAAHGVEDLAERAKASVKMRKGIEDDLTALFGKQLDKSLTQQLSTATAAAAKGDAAQLAKLLKAVPEHMRQSVVISAIGNSFGKATRNGRLNFNSYARWYEGVQKNKQVLSLINSNLPEGAAQRFHDLYKVSDGVAKSLKEFYPTGRTQIVNEQFKNADGVIGRLYDVAKQAAIRAPIEFATSAMGLPGVGLAGALASSMQGGARPAIKLADEVMASPAFKQSVIDVATGKPVEQVKRRFAVSPQFKKFARYVMANQPAGQTTEGKLLRLLFHKAAAPNGDSEQSAQPIQEGEL